jgi:uncharacterized delta-60 repeat protein
LKSPNTSSVHGVNTHFHKWLKSRSIRAVAAATPIEALESRRLLTAITWLGGGGNWNDPNQWSTHTVPGANDDVTIGAAGSVVTVNDSESAATLTDLTGTIITIDSSGSLHILGAGANAGTLNVNGVFADDQQLVNTGAINYSAANEIDSLLNQGMISFGAGPITFGGAVVNDTAGTLDFTTDTILAHTAGGGVTNNGVIIKSGGTGASSFAGFPAFANTGTIEAASGTLVITTQPFFNGGTLPDTVFPGATYKVDAGATLATDQPENIGINDGTVILNGIGASFPAIDALTTNNGTFGVLTGATFVSSFPLTNTGTLTVAGRVAINGNFTQSQNPGTPSSPPTLSFAIGGAPVTADAPILTETGFPTLAGNLTASFVNGFSTANSTYTVARFNAAATGSFASTAGVVSPITAAVNSTSIVLNVGAGSAPAGIGGLDPTFGANGLASYYLGFTSTAGLVIQADGKSVIAGTAGATGAHTFAITRYGADGSLDTIFGTNAVTNTSFGGDDQAAAEALLSDGDILVAGTATTLVDGVVAGSQFAVAEYTPAGFLDTNFGNGTGKVLVSFSATAGALSNDTARALVVAADGTIYIGGSSDANGHGMDFAIAALTPAGNLATAFSGMGKVLLDLAGGDDSIGALALAPKNQLIAAGSAANPSSGVSSVALADFLTTGALDTHFGTKGKVITPVGGVDDQASSVAIDRSGRIVVGGSTATGSAAAGTLSADFLLLRYNSAGKLDRVFGHGGVVITSFDQPAAITRVLVSPTGTIVASGKTAASLMQLNADALDLAVARYSVNGKLDPTFNGTGEAILPLPAIGESESLSTAGGMTEQPALLRSASSIPFDTASDLMAAFQQLTQSAQGAVATTNGGDLLDVGNSNGFTIEAAVIAMGVDLNVRLNVHLPPTVIGGGKGTLAVNITEMGTDSATGTYAIQLFASETQVLASDETPFRSIPEKLNLKSGQGKTIRLTFQYPAALADGNYFLAATVVTGAVHDLNSANNTAVSSYPVLIAMPFVRLAGSDLKTPAFDGAKSAFASLSLMNAGNEPASKPFAMQFFASTDGGLSDAIPLETVPIRTTLRPGASRAFRLKLSLPATLPAGTYKLLALLDVANVFQDPDAAMNFVVSDSSFVVG